MFTPIVFHTRLVELCKARGTSITRFTEDVLKLSSSVPTGWKKGACPSSEVVYACAEYFHVSSDYLIGLSDRPQSTCKLEYSSDEQDLINELRTADLHARELGLASMRAVLQAAKKQNSKLRLAGLVAAGTPLYEEFSEEEMVSVPSRFFDRDRYFVVKAHGNSMEPEIPNGSFIIVQRNSRPEQGELAVVSLEGSGFDHEYAVKCVRFHADEIELRSYNPDYPPVFYPLTDIRSAEKVVHVISPR